MKPSIRVLALVLALALVPTLAFAGSPWVDESTAAKCIAAKFAFGVKNLLFGWTEFFTEPWEYHKEGKNCWEGLGKGLINGVGQTVGGALHAATFFIPVDVPLPENGTSLLK